jgi:selenocysteine lyase/cysteine desulfurase
LDLPAGDSAIISLDLPNAVEKLKTAGVRTAIRAGKVRVSFHLYNTAQDVSLAVSALQ